MFPSIIPTNILPDWSDFGLPSKDTLSERVGPYEVAVVVVGSGVGVGVTLVEGVLVLDRSRSCLAGEVVGLGVILATGVLFCSWALLLILVFWETR